jgi:AAHS family 4-hydroxybenzoate transporter-like MFS transporter
MRSIETTQAVLDSGSVARFRVAGLCAAVLLIEGYDIAVVGYVIPLLADAWRLAPGAFTYVLTAGNLGLLIGSLIAGLLGDRFGRKPVLIASVVTFGVCSFASAFVASPMQLAATRALTGLGLGGGIPLAIALASDFAPAIARGRFVLLSSLGVPIGFALAGLLSGRLTGAFGWPAVFVAGGAAPLLLALLLVLRLPEAPAFRGARPPSSSGVAALFREERAPSPDFSRSLSASGLRISESCFARTTS